MQSRLHIGFVLIISLVVQTALAVPVIVGFYETVDDGLIVEYGIEKYHKHDLINAISADISQDTIESLKKNSKIRYVEEDSMVQAVGKPVPKPTSVIPSPPQQVSWGIIKVLAPEGWRYSTGTNVKIAILDTGISSSHSDLRVTGGINLVGKVKNSKWNDDNGHGTHVAGIIAARNNSIGVIGVAPDSNIYAVKVLNANGKGNVSDIIEGIDWAVQNKMDIVSMSLGTTVYSRALDDATRSAYNSGILLVAAAGNDGDGDITTNEVIYPAKFDSVIAVAAIDDACNYQLWSATGPEVELAAPGVNILSTSLNNEYFVASGTSMASPFVTGVAALVKGNDPARLPDQIREIMVSRVVDLGTNGRDSAFGFGMVQARL